MPVEVGDDVARLVVGDAELRYDRPRLDLLRVDDPADRVVGVVRDLPGDVADVAEVVERGPDAAVRALHARDAVAAAAAVALDQALAVLGVPALDDGGRVARSAAARESGGEDEEERGPPHRSQGSRTIVPIPVRTIRARKRPSIRS